MYICNAEDDFSSTFLIVLNVRELDFDCVKLWQRRHAAKTELAIRWPVIDNELIRPSKKLH